jgi:hypothetical protein
MDNVPIRRGIMIAGQTLSVDPYTGKLLNLAKPFAKAEANRIAPDHTVIVNKADGSIEHVTLKGMTYTELRDASLVTAIATGDWSEYLAGRRVTNEQWHSYIITLADKYPHLVKTADTIKPVINDEEELVS